MNPTPVELIAEEVRAVMARRRVTQAALARDVFGGIYRQWIAARYDGKEEWGSWELVRVADYLDTDVVQFLNAAKRGTPRGGDGADIEDSDTHDGDAPYYHPAPAVRFATPTACIAA